jgi:hypothetical protein
MLTTNPNTSADLATTLLVQYSFDLNGYSARELINCWQGEYETNWLHIAVIEALYQGRYKAVSVQQILNFWQRRGQVIHHFNMEFERLICSKFPESLAKMSKPVLPPAKNSLLDKYHPRGDSFVKPPSFKVAVETPVSQPKLLPPAMNNPPIGQFTPQKSDRSELFTSKLKAVLTAEV